MGLLDKLKFWKKDDGLDFGKQDGFGGMSNQGFGKDMGMGNPSQQGFGQDQGFGHDPGMPNDNFSGQDPFNQNRGMPDASNFRGVGDEQSRQQMNQNISQHMRNAEEAPPFSAQKPQFQEQGNSDMQIISAKLDAIKATLDAMNQRISNLERVAYDKQHEW